MSRSAFFSAESHDMLDLQKNFTINLLFIGMYASRL